MAARRSIVSFESWLAGQIDDVKADLHLLDQDATALERRRAAQQVKLETLLFVAGRLATADGRPKAQAPHREGRRPGRTKLVDDKTHRTIRAVPVVGEAPQAPEPADLMEALRKSAPVA